MKKYTIATQAIIYQTFTVEAENKKEAREILYSGKAELVETDSEVNSVDVLSIEEVNDDE